MNLTKSSASLGVHFEVGFGHIGPVNSISYSHPIFSPPIPMDITKAWIQQSTCIFTIRHFIQNLSGSMYVIAIFKFENLRTLFYIKVMGIF